MSCGNSSVVEHFLAKEGVASSSLVSRSRIFFFFSITYDDILAWNRSLSMRAERAENLRSFQRISDSQSSLSIKRGESKFDAEGRLA